MERIAVIMGKMHSGGKKNLVMEYYRHMDRNKIQFDFICDMDSNAIPKEEIETMEGRVFEIAPYQNILRNLSDIRKICKENKYKIIHGYNGTMNVFSMFAGWLSGIPIRINESISMAHNFDKKTIIKRILRPFSRCFSTHYMANGEACGRWQFGNRFYEQGRVEIFRTVIDTAKNSFDPMLRDAVRSTLGVENSLVVGHIGRLTEQKNTLFIIEIFNEILIREPSAKLLIIGDGNLKEAMIKKITALGIRDSVIYLGRREDIQQFYNAMDCFLLPSLYEGLPVVGLEAETCGLPVFFSTEISKESSPCTDIGYFMGLDRPASEWAEKIIEKTKNSIATRKSRTDEVKEAGFDSEREAGKLMTYYECLLLRDKKNEKCNK